MQSPFACDLEPWQLRSASTLKRLPVHARGHLAPGGLQQFAPGLRWLRRAVLYYVVWPRALL
eukprot:5511755-Amphidinium_carterae.1